MGNPTPEEIERVREIARQARTRNEAADLQRAQETAAKVDKKFREAGEKRG